MNTGPQKDRRKELEERVNKAMKEIHDKGMGEGRGEEYQKRQVETLNLIDYAAIVWILGWIVIGVVYFD
mgnify:CR=1 FL=1